jgi:hypothetical protein
MLAAGVPPCGSNDQAERPSFAPFPLHERSGNERRAHWRSSRTTGRTAPETGLVPRSLGVTPAPREPSDRDR